MDTYLKPILRHRVSIIHLGAATIIEFEIIFVLFERLLLQWGAPGASIYITDILNIILFCLMINKKIGQRFKSVVVSYSVIVLLSAAIAVANYLEWKGNPLFTIIELRNIVRFLIFFLACVSFLDEARCKRIYKILTIFFFANVPLIVYQYFAFHPIGVWTRGDYLNGLFGTTVGGNTFVNVTMLVVVTYLLSRWSNGEISTRLFLSAIFLSLLVAGLMELKAYFIEFFILYAWYLLKKKKSKKEKIVNVAAIVLLLLFSYYVLQLMYQEYPWFRETMSWSGMLGSLTGNGYTGTGDLNRFTGLFTISTDFFNGNIVDILLGIGAGNCSTFSLGGTTTQFYSLYESSHYNWFSSTFIFVQCGLVGLILYLYTFINLLIKNKNNSLFSLNSQIICILALFLIFYGEALKTDIGYLVYFAIASGFIQTKRAGKIYNSDWQ